jgi:hypothetical protein
MVASALTKANASVNRAIIHYRIRSAWIEHDEGKVVTNAPAPG